MIQVMSYLKLIANYKTLEAHFISEKTSHDQAMKYAANDVPAYLCDSADILIFREGITGDFAIYTKLIELKKNKECRAKLVFSISDKFHGKKETAAFIDLVKGQADLFWVAQDKYSHKHWQKQSIPVSFIPSTGFFIAHELFDAVPAPTSLAVFKSTPATIVTALSMNSVKFSVIDDLYPPHKLKGVPVLFIPMHVSTNHALRLIRAGAVILSPTPAFLQSLVNVKSHGKESLVPHVITAFPSDFQNFLNVYSQEYSPFIHQVGSWEGIDEFVSSLKSVSDADRSVFVEKYQAEALLLWRDFFANVLGVAVETQEPGNVNVELNEFEILRIRMLRDKLRATAVEEERAAEAARVEAEKKSAAKEAEKDKKNEAKASENKRWVEEGKQLS